jgi:small-conductance mechanosensitive channel
MMAKDLESISKTGTSQKRAIIITFLGSIIMVLLIIATLEISDRNLSTFVVSQQKYILSIESTLLVAFVVEMLARLATLRSLTPQMLEHGIRVRLIVRIMGYTIGSLSVISILASNATLGISVGAIAGVVIAFAAQNIVGSLLAAIVILSTHLVKVGEEITIGQTKGVVSNINLTHTVLSVEDDVVFIPNSLIVSSAVRRKKRNPGKNADVNDW